nr:MAG TPA: hypothetical protein [Caudoviricetes sp.]
MDFTVLLIRGVKGHTRFAFEICRIRFSILFQYFLPLSLQNVCSLMCLYYSTQENKIKRFYKIYSRIRNVSYWTI